MTTGNFCTICHRDIIKGDKYIAVAFDKLGNFGKMICLNCVKKIKKQKLEEK